MSQVRRTAGGPTSARDGLIQWDPNSARGGLPQIGDSWLLAGWPGCTLGPLARTSTGYAVLVLLQPGLLLRDRGPEASQRLRRAQYVISARTVRMLPLEPFGKGGCPCGREAVWNPLCQGDAVFCLRYPGVGAEGEACPQGPESQAGLIHCLARGYCSSTHAVGVSTLLPSTRASPISVLCSGGSLRKCTTVWRSELGASAGRFVGDVEPWRAPEAERAREPAVRSTAPLSA